MFLYEFFFFWSIKKQKIVYFFFETMSKSEFTQEGEQKQDVSINDKSNETKPIKAREGHSDSSSDSDSDSDDELIGPQLINSKVQKSSRERNDIERPQQDYNESASNIQKVENIRRLDSTSIKSTGNEGKKSLLQLHQEKSNNSGISSKNKITKFDSKEALNKEVRNEIFKNLEKNGGLKGKFKKTGE